MVIHGRKFISNPKTGAARLVMDPTNSNKLIAAMWEHKRDPWFFNSGEKEVVFLFHMMVEKGKKNKRRRLPKGELGRIGLAIAKNKPNIVACPCRI